MKGLVKFFNKEKAYGFIKGEDGDEYFVHISGVLSRELNEGDRVEFDTKEGKKGLNAINVSIV